MSDPILKIRRAHYTDANDSTAKRVSLVATKPVSDETDDGHSDEDEDLYFGGEGGGGGGAKCFALVSVSGDYLVCQPYPYQVTEVSVSAGGTGYAVGDMLSPVDGTGTAAIFTVSTISGGGSTGPITGVAVTEAGSYTAKPSTPNSVVYATGHSGSGSDASLALSFGDINVAKPRTHRHSKTSEKVENVDITYNYASRAHNLDGKRTAAASGATSQVEILLPVYHDGALDGDTEVSIITADKPEGGTGVVVGGVELEFEDTNRDARAWTQIA